ncbi:MAG: dehydrogenase E1 component subunit alpha/beta [Bacteriovoracaceae bacterium]
MFDRTKNIEGNFKQFLLSESNSEDFTELSSNLCHIKLTDIFESQIISRLLDIKARKLRAQGKSYYTIGSSGHEGMATVGEVARLTDMAFLHYRDAAFLIQRSKKLPGQTIIHDMLLSFCASSEDPVSGGRHKVLGSKALHVPPQTSTIASHLPKAVGAALSIRKAKKMGIKGVLPEDAVVVCTFGDASLNHASSQTALNCAEWISYQNLPLPLVLICEDNGIGISVRTPPEWVASSRAPSRNMKYFECDGLDIIKSYYVVSEAFEYARTHARPVFIRFKTVRLMGHAGSDIEAVYRTLKEMDTEERKDPLIKNAKSLIANGILTHRQILSLYEKIEKRIDRIAEDVVQRPKLTTPDEIMAPLISKTKLRESPDNPTEEDRKKVFDSDWEQLDKLHPMSKLINFGLTDILLKYNAAVVFGEDVAKKGGVYNITANLENRFGKNKVFNSLLDETSILGSAIGLAHNGFLPIPEIQFLAYVHNAEDQLRGEASTLSFFSNGQYTNGMVIRIAGLAYQKGFGGHFHNDNSIAVFRDIPGIIIACPSNGKDAVLMMRSCIKEAFEYGRIVVFIEPIAIYPIRDLLAAHDQKWCHTYPKDLNDNVPIGEFGIIEGDKSLCIISYGNGHYLSHEARKDLIENYGVNPTLIDLRWIAPLDEGKLSRTLSQFAHVLVVEECRKTGSLSESLMTMMIEHCSPLPKIKRVCSYDTFIPLGDAAQIALVSSKDIIEASIILMGLGEKK